MSDWVEYCNLEYEGEFAKMRIENGNTEPFGVKYWSVGNENYGGWELGAKDSATWGRLVLESTKLINHVDPDVSLTAAALGDIDWDLNLLRSAHERLEWISLHQYWDAIHSTNNAAGYDKCMDYTRHTGDAIRRTRGLLTALGLDKRIRIAFDEWNLRGWYHPNVHTAIPAKEKEKYLYPRDDNDINSIYTMADAVFSACFLNECLRNADIVGMANFAPVVNTRGAIFTYDGGIVKRSTYYVFEMYVKYMGDTVIDSYATGCEKYRIDSEGARGEVDCIDTVATLNSANGSVAISLINKHADEEKEIKVFVGEHRNARVVTLSGRDKDDYNDVGREYVVPFDNSSAITADADGELRLTVPAHSVNVLMLEF